MAFGLGTTRRRHDDHDGAPSARNHEEHKERKDSRRQLASYQRLSPIGGDARLRLRAAGIGAKRGTANGV
jgi:hypothetical protein